MKFGEKDKFGLDLSRYDWIVDLYFFVKSDLLSIFTDAVASLKK